MTIKMLFDAKGTEFIMSSTKNNRKNKLNKITITWLQTSWVKLF